MELLTEREQEITKLASAGRENTEIATELHISTGTVASHLRNIYNKLHLRNRVELANYWTKLQAV